MARREYCCVREEREESKGCDRYVEKGFGGRTGGRRKEGRKGLPKIGKTEDI